MAKHRKGGKSKKGLAAHIAGMKKARKGGKKVRKGGKKRAKR